MTRPLKLEIILCVAITYLRHNLAPDEIYLRGRQQPLFNLIAYQIAQRAAEIFMTRIRQKRARIGQHPHKTAEQPQIRERRHLAFHPVFLIEEPPYRRGD